MTEALLKTGKHTITALTRADSQSKLPEGVIVKTIDYSKPETIVEALRGQDALVITLRGFTPREIDIALIKAAGEAGVPWILPNEWATDTANEELAKDLGFETKGKHQLGHFEYDMKKCLLRYRVCRNHSQRHQRPWTKFLHRRYRGLLVRMEPSDSISFWYRLCQSKGHIV
jgi:hypothetical protein